MVGKHTINDIARLAGVSKATVSRVLNHKPDVDPATRERILRIMEEQGFVPSITASGLASGRSRLIGVLVASFTWPLIPDIIHGVAEVVERSSYELVLYSINDSSRESDKWEMIDHILATKLTSGLLAIMPGQSSRHIARLHSYGFPVVIVDDEDPPASAPWVGVDNRGGAYAAVRHLLRLGHRRIAHIQGPMRRHCSRERYQGYLQALEEEGIALDPALVVEGEFTTASGRAAACKLFSLPKEQRPTAIFAGNDGTAYGVLAAAEEHGLRVPGDIALVGFDDVATSAHVRPALTTVRQPFYEMGQLGAELLLSMLDNTLYVPEQYLSPEQRSQLSRAALVSSSSERAAARNGNACNHVEPVHIQLATSLVVRASCGSPHRLTVSPAG
ncbi:MAG TPA: LacI family DNA-binding transcriptional regulator [Ktedonobacteraceae bacterium]|jgi:LacI family transcriptional regulator|nr:LacI family DNA-binding transcriptional regulator [Ktedonobacteraceae bacterium]